MIDYERLLKEMEAFRELSRKGGSTVRLKPYTLVHLRDIVINTPVTLTIHPAGGTEAYEIAESWELLAVHSFMSRGCLLSYANARPVPYIDTVEFTAVALHDVFVHRKVTVWEPLVFTFDAADTRKATPKLDIMLAVARHEIETLL